MGVIISLFVVLYNIVLYFIALTRRRVSCLPQYSFYVFSLIGWVITLYIYNSTGESSWLLPIARLNVEFTFLLAYSVFEFFLYFPNRFPLNEIIIWPIRFGAIVFSYLTLFTAFIDQSESIMKGIHIAQFGILFPVYVLYILIAISFAIYIIVQKIKYSGGEDKVKMYYIITGGMLSVIFMLLTQLILPVAFNVYAFMVVGTLSLLFITFYMNLVVTSQDFHNFKMTLITIGHNISLFIFYVGLFYLLDISANYFFGSVFTGEAIGYIAFIFLLLIVISDQIFIVSHKIWEKVFNYDLEKLSLSSDELIRNMSSIYNIDDLLGSTLVKLNQHFEVSKSGILVYKDTVETSYGATFNFIIDQKTEEVLNRQKVIYVYDKNLNSEIKKNLSDAGLAFIYLLTLKSFTRGYYLVGEKEQKNFFDIEEQERMSKIIEFLNMTIERALLFDENSKLVQNLEQKVREATIELEKKNIDLQKAYEDESTTAQEQGDMLDIMGHELRTPATVIKMASYLLEDQLTEESQKKQLFRIKDSINRQIRLINTFINTAKIENNKIELVLEPVHMNELVKSSVEDHMNDAIEKGLTLEYEDNGEMPYVLADTARIREVIDNFITNAVKYTANGYVKVRCYVKDNNVVVGVEDSGEGISAEDKEELFQKFKRLKNFSSTSDTKGLRLIRPGGTGLGLYVSKGVVELHKGNIWVDSELGKGSTFSFSLPIASSEDVVKYKQEEDSTLNMFHKLHLNN